MTLHPLAPTTGRDENGKAMIPGAADWGLGQHILVVRRMSRHGDSVGSEVQPRKDDQSWRPHR